MFGGCGCTHVHTRMHVGMHLAVCGWTNLCVSVYTCACTPLSMQGWLWGVCACSYSRIYTEFIYIYEMHTDSSFT